LVITSGSDSDDLGSNPRRALLLLKGPLKCHSIYFCSIFPIKRIKAEACPVALWPVSLLKTFAL
jgi:hypothetical protein